MLLGGSVRYWCLRSLVGEVMVLGCSVCCGIDGFDGIRVWMAGYAMGASAMKHVMPEVLFGNYGQAYYL